MGSTTAIVIGCISVLGISLLIIYILRRSGNAEKKSTRTAAGNCLATLFGIAGLWLVWEYIYAVLFSSYSPNLNYLFAGLACLGIGVLFRRDAVPYKKCPMCGERVREEALVCKHCHHSFAEVEPPSSQESS